ncbi:MAG: helix-turn-helix domain-containing protein [Proteobacteria bacterium]|nr:helix-turn-helix domain-containing protein [Pseudomonadota bacterium]
MEEMIEREKVAEILGVKQSRVYQLIRCGMLAGVRDPEAKRWYVPRSEVDRYIEHRVPRGRPKKVV